MLYPRFMESGKKGARVKEKLRHLEAEFERRCEERTQQLTAELERTVEFLILTSDAVQSKLCRERVLNVDAQEESNRG